MYARSHLTANCHCRRTSLTLVTHRAGADSPATYMIWMAMMTVIHKKSQLFFQIKSFGKRHLMKTPSNSLWFTNWIIQQSISKHIKMSEVVWFGIDSKYNIRTCNCIFYQTRIRCWKALRIGKNILHNVSTFHIVLLLAKIIILIWMNFDCFIYIYI